MISLEQWSKARRENIKGGTFGKYALHKLTSRGTRKNVSQPCEGQMKLIVTHSLMLPFTDFAPIHAHST